jgi:hypothetical protein
VRSGVVSARTQHGVCPVGGSLTNPDRRRGPAATFQRQNVPPGGEEGFLDASSASWRSRAGGSGGVSRGAPSADLGSGSAGSPEQVRAGILPRIGVWSGSIPGAQARTAASNGCTGALRRHHAQAGSGRSGAGGQRQLTGMAMPRRGACLVRRRWPVGHRLALGQDPSHTARNLIGVAGDDSHAAVAAG